jgi:hypothetical protein
MSTSIGEQVAKRFGIPHQYGDLNDEERIKLGIRHEHMIRAGGWHLDGEKERVEREIRASHSIREGHWLNQILEHEPLADAFRMRCESCVAFRKTARRKWDNRAGN